MQGCDEGNTAAESRPKQPGLGVLSSIITSQEALYSPTRRLLQDSVDMPVTVSPLRADRVLLFRDALILLQVCKGTDTGLGHEGLEAGRRRGKT